MYKIITLSNGKRVGNFSSPHEFVFEDGNILPAVSESIADHLKVTFLETVHENGDVSLTFDLSTSVLHEMKTWVNLWINKEVDVVFCPLPMITALSERGYDIKNSPFRSIRIEDRIKKLVSINKQCI